jgi:hypothetical protein
MCNKSNNVFTKIHNLLVNFTKITHLTFSRDICHEKSEPYISFISMKLKSM